MVIRIGSAAGVNGPVIFLTKGTCVHPRIKGFNLMTWYILSEVSCAVPNEI